MIGGYQMAVPLSEEIGLVMLKIRDEIEQAKRPGLANTNYVADLEQRLEVHRERRDQIIQDEINVANDTDEDLY